MNSELQSPFWRVMDPCTPLSLKGLSHLRHLVQTQKFLFCICYPMFLDNTDHQESLSIVLDWTSHLMYVVNIYCRNIPYGSTAKWTRVAQVWNEGYIQYVPGESEQNQQQREKRRKARDKIQRHQGKTTADGFKQDEKLLAMAFPLFFLQRNHARLN